MAAGREPGSHPFHKWCTAGRQQLLVVNRAGDLQQQESDTGVVTTAANRQVSLSKDPLTGLLRVASVSGLSDSLYDYDGRGRLLSVTSGDRITRYDYDDLVGKGQLTALTNAEGEITRFDYDLMGRVNRITYPDGRVLEQAYDFEGNLVSLLPPGQPAHRFNYTSSGRTSSYTPPALAGISDPVTYYDYDRDRKLTTITRPDGAQLLFGYAPGTSRLQQMTTPLGSYHYRYNGHGQLSEVEAPTGDTLTTSYDGKLITSQQWAGAINCSVSWGYNSDFALTSQCINGSCLSYSYDDDGLVTQVGELILGREAQKGGLINSSQLGSLSMVRSSNGFGETSSESHSHDGTPLLAASYSRDRLGRITSRTLNVLGQSVSDSYHYDAAGRLWQVERGSTSVSYSYDDNGNRLSKTTVSDAGTTTVSASYDAQDRLLTAGTCSYSYSANGELQQKTCGTATTQYDYDLLGNLRQVWLPGDATIDYLTDGQDRRIGKRVNGVLVQGLLYGDQLNPVAELDGSGALVSRFVYASQGHVPDYMVKGGITYRIISDHLGSPRLVVNAATGEVAQQLDYDEFGVVTRDTNPGFQPFGFAGGLYEPATGLTRFGRRDYDAETGRWTSKDPIRFGGGDSNLYGYVFADPVNLIDPSGLAAENKGIIGTKFERPGPIDQSGRTGTVGNPYSRFPPAPRSPSEQMINRIISYYLKKASLGVLQVAPKTGAITVSWAGVLSAAFYSPGLGGCSAAGICTDMVVPMTDFTYLPISDGSMYEFTPIQEYWIYGDYQIDQNCNG